MVQMKEQIKAPEKELHKMEISNLSDVEFKTLVIWMLKELSRDLNSIKKIQSETKDTPIEIKNNLQGNAVEQIKLRIKSMLWNIRKPKTTNQNNKEKKNKKTKQTKNKDSISSLLGNFKCPNIHIIGVLEEKRKGKKLEIYLKK